MITKGVSHAVFKKKRHVQKKPVINNTLTRIQKK